MNLRIKLLYVPVLLLVLNSCTEKYFPEIDEEVSTLIIDGKITNGIGSCEVRLFRPVKFTDKFDLKPEKDATIILHDNHNRNEILIEHEPGVYRNSSLIIEGEVGSSYWIEIQTLSGDKYESRPELMPAAYEISPLYGEEIEDITSSTSKKTGIRIFFNAKTKDKFSSYIRWEYQESYEWHSPFRNTKPHTANPSRICYPVINLNQINVFDASKLTNKEINHLHSSTVYNNEVKFLFNHLTDIKVYAITKQTYLFWENMKNLHQSNGSLYDVIPANIKGNIETCSDNCQVLGNFEASSVRNRQGIFNSTDFSMEFPVFPDECEEFEVVFEEIPPDPDVYHILRNNGPVYTLQFLECYECNVVYPVNKPSFWP